MDSVETFSGIRSDGTAAQILFSASLQQQALDLGKSHFC